MRRPTVIVVVFVAALALLIAALAWLVHELSPSAHVSLENRVSRTVQEEIVRISASSGDRVEVASVETRETYRDLDALKVGPVDLGTTETAISVPVVYRFHIALSEGMKVDVTRHGDLARCVVHAPEIRPTLPPAIRTEGIEKRSKNGWARFNADENMAALEKSLTGEMVLRARGKTVLARDKAREAIARFVSRWLMRDELWGGPGGIREIVVLFPGEKEDTLVAPVLRKD